MLKYQIPKKDYEMTALEFSDFMEWFQNSDPLEKQGFEDDISKIIGANTKEKRK